MLRCLERTFLLGALGTARIRKGSRKCCHLYRDSGFSRSIPEQSNDQALMMAFVGFINRTSH
jgi:hypothetical protein